MDDVSTDGANAAKAARWAEGCRRHKAISQLVDYGKQPLPRSIVEDVAWELGVSRATLYRPIEPLQDLRHGRRAPTQRDGKKIRDLGIAQSHGANHRGDNPQCLSQTHTTNADPPCHLRTRPMH